MRAWNFINSEWVVLLSFDIAINISNKSARYDIFIGTICEVQDGLEIA
jgi:hypothetical protein